MGLIADNEDKDPIDVARTWVGGKTKTWSTAGSPRIVPLRIFESVVYLINPAAKSIFNSRKEEAEYTASSFS